MNLTIKDILQMFQGQSVQLAAGSGGVENIVTSVNIMDAPDIWHWVKPGELILTTAFAVKDDPELQKTLIRELSLARCAGLGIKTKRFLPEIPTLMREAANEYNLPILELPLQLSLAEIMNPIVSSIAARQSYLFQRSNEIHKTLTNVAISSGGLSAIIECLGNLTQCPIGCYDVDIQALNLWFPDTMQGVHNETMLQLQTFAKNKILERHELQKQLSRTKSPFTEHVSINDRSFLLTSCAIMSNDKYFGHISIIQASPAFLDINCLALEHACTVAALEFLKQKAVAETRRLHSRDILERILFDDPNSQHTKDLIAASIIGQAKEFQCVVIELDDAPEEMNIPVLLTRLYKITQQIVSSAYPSALVSEHAGRIIVLAAATQSFKSLITDVLRKTQVNFKDKHKEATISIGVGPLVTGLKAIRQSYQDALICINLGRRIKGCGRITLPHEVASYALLSPNSGISEVFTQVFETSIAKLEEADKQSGLDLLKTLEKYLETDRNLTETAKELYIHRNTLSNRLDRIIEITGLDFGDREHLFGLRLVLRRKALTS